MENRAQKKAMKRMPCTLQSIYIKETCVWYLLDSRWSDRRETLHVGRVGHGHENSQGPMSIALC